MNRLSVIFIICLFIISIFCFETPAKIRSSEVNGAVAAAVEYFESGNCNEAMPVLDELVNGDYGLVKQNPNLEYTLLYYSGFCSKSLGEYDKSYDYFVRALRLAKKNEAEDQVPVIYTFLGEVSKELGEYKRAAVYYNYAISSLDEEENALDIAAVLYLLAENYRSGKDYKMSLDSCEKSSAISSRLKNARLQISCLTSSGEVYNESGDYSQAIKMFNSGLSIARSAQMPIEMGNNHMGLALVYESMEIYDLAKQNYDEALRFYAVSSATVNVPVIVQRLIDLPVKITSKQAEKSIENYLNNVSVMLGDADEASIMDMYLLIGIYYVYAEDLEAAKINFENVLKLSYELNYNAQAYKAAMYLSGLYYNEGMKDEAVKVLIEAESYFKGKSAVLLDGISVRKKSYLDDEQKNITGE